MALSYVSVIIPHYNDLENLEICLALLESQTFPSDRFEVIVAENNSACGFDAVVRACGPGVNVIPAAIQGAAEARNAAIRTAKGDILAFIDSDCRPAPTWLEHGVAALAKADLVGGRVDVSVVDPAHPTAVEAFEKVYAFDYRRYVEQEGFALTANMFAPRAIFDKVGAFRAGYAEDVDWGKRASKMGFTWFCADDSAVSHPARRNWPKLTKKWQRLARESFVGMQEQSAWRLRWVSRSGLLILSPFLHIPRVFQSQEPTSLEFKLRAIAILFAIRWWRVGENVRLLLSSDRRPPT